MNSARAAVRRPILHMPCPPEGTGLARDRRILARQLAALGIASLDFPRPGYPPESKRFLLKRLTTPRIWRGTYDANLFLERIDPRWFRMGRQQLFMPNPEWLREECRALLPRIDRVLCKTRHAEAIFAALGCRTVLTGFTSMDIAAACARSARPQQAHYADPRPLHLAGASRMKGTAAVLEAWRRHPEWPQLTVLVRAEVLEDIGGSLPPNVRILSRYVDDTELAQLMGSHNIHLCPSEAEGWGHSIVEAMGCAALVVTSDAPPMNELVDGERGLTVATGRGVALRAGWRFPVSVEALEQSIATALDLGASRRMQLGHAARDWYEANERNFASALGQVLGECLGQ